LGTQAEPEIAMSQTTSESKNQRKPSQRAKQTLTQAQAFILPITPNNAIPQTTDYRPPGETQQFSIASMNSSNTLKTVVKSPTATAGRQPSEMSRKGSSSSSRSSGDRSRREKSTVPSAWWRAMNYRCHFCVKVLAPMEMKSLDYVFWLLGFRQMYCQHCFIAHYRPFGLLKLLLAPFRWVYFNLADEE